MSAQEIGIKKLEQSIGELEHALSYSSRIEEDIIYLAAISKCFESCLEYSWKYLRRLVIKEGIEVYSPKDTIRNAGRMDLIEDVELWIKFINIRNIAVHDYQSISDEDYIAIVRSFLVAAKKLL